MSLKPSASAPNSSFDSTGSRTREFALRHPLQALLELVHGADDEQEREIDERNGAGDRERHERELDAAQERGRARNVVLQRHDQPIDGRDEALELARASRGRAAGCDVLERWA